MRATSDAPAGRDTSAAFTLIELLAVIAAVVLIAAILLPVVTDHRPARGVNCLNNKRQLTLGWILYAGDWNDVLIRNRPYAGKPGAPTNNWIAGVMDWTTNSDNTNRELLLSPSECSMASYVKNAGVYLCPADDSVSAAGPRIRSVSMNAFLGGGSNETAFSGWKMHLKLNDLRNPAGTFVIADEHPNSIDDGSFFVNPNQTNAWVSLPAARHKGAGGFGFADGHSEIHKWVDAGTIQPMIPNGPKPSVLVARGERGADLAWVLSAMTRPDTNAPGGP
jgi:prepilin-type processing-associated H-X9-DG protein